jgi:hypothetical protein
MVGQSMTLPAKAQGMFEGGMKMQAQGMDGRKPGVSRNWLAILGNATANGGASVAVDASGSVLVAGASNSQALLAKLDATASPQWISLFSAAVTYNPSTPELNTVSLAVDPTGAFHFVGSNSLNEIIAAKFSASGLVQWQRTASGGGGFDRAYRVAVAPSGNVYSAAMLNGLGYAGDRCALVKYNSSGTLQWTRHIDIGGHSTGLCLDGSENAYVSGPNGYIAKINSSGVVQWQRVVTGFTGYGVAAFGGSLYFAGSDGGSTAILICYDTTGAYQWSRSLGSSGGNRFNSVAVDAAGGIYVCGSTTQQGAGASDVLLARYTSAGVLVWQRTLGATGNDYGCGIATSGTDVYFTGQTSLGAGSGDVLVGRIPGDGSLTGTIGDIRYAPSTLANAAWSHSDAASGAANKTVSLTDTAASFTTSAAALASTVSRF